MTHAGVIVPQGVRAEFSGLSPPAAWERTVSVAREAERLGFESVWLPDHFHTVPDALDELTFEPFVALAALAAQTSRVRLGHMVLCAGFRNAALTAKMISTLDVVSAGRAELGIGAGWVESDWRSYGYGFPALRERLAILSDHLEVITRMLGPGRATFEGQRASVDGAINLPKGLQRPRLPIVVGGNGRDVTWRLAARHADELNVTALTPDEVRDALPVIASRCEEAGRDPATLKLSVLNIEWKADGKERSRADMLEAYVAAGVDRVVTSMRDATGRDDAVESFADDCRAAGVTLEPTGDEPD